MNSDLHIYSRVYMYFASASSSIPRERVWLPRHVCVAMEVRIDAATEEQERKVKEFMKKKEQELQQGCQVEKKPEGDFFNT